MVILNLMPTAPLKKVGTGACFLRCCFNPSFNSCVLTFGSLRRSVAVVFRMKCFLMWDFSCSTVRGLLVCLVPWCMQCDSSGLQSIFLPAQIQLWSYTVVISTECAMALYSQKYQVLPCQTHCLDGNMFLGNLYVSCNICASCTVNAFFGHGPSSL